MDDENISILLKLGIFGGLLYFGAKQARDYFSKKKTNMNPSNNTLEFTIDAKKLADRGWEFDDKNGYRFFQKNQFNYTDKELEDYASFVEASEVNLIIRDNEAFYLINRKGTDWSQADAHVDAGDFDMVVEDLQELGLIKSSKEASS